MRIAFKLALVLLIFGAALGFAQTPAPPITTTQVALPVSTNLAPVTSAAVTVVGNPGPQSYYYWTVASYLGNATSPTGPWIAANAPNTLSGTNYNQITPAYPVGASVDILRTASATPPIGACNCAVVIAATSGTINDIGSALLNYTVAPFNANNFGLTLDNEVESSNVTNLILRQNGVFVANLSIAGGVGTVTGPGSSTTGDIVLWNNQLGTALSDSSIAFPLPNTALANSSTTVNGQTCTLGSTCTIATSTNPMTTLGDTTYGGAAGALTRLAGPTTPNGVNYFYESIPAGGLAVAEVWGLPGIVGRAVTSTTSTDTILSTDCNPKRVEYVGTVNVAVTLPTATALGLPSCEFKLVNSTASSTITITPTTWTVNGSATLALTPGQSAVFFVDPNSTTNWVADGAANVLNNQANTFTAAGTLDLHLGAGSAFRLPAPTGTGCSGSLNLIGQICYQPNNGLIAFFDVGGGNAEVLAAYDGSNTTANRIPVVEPTTQFLNNSSITDAGAGVFIGSPTGGAKGAGTLNATGIFVNGTAVGGSQVYPGAGVPISIGSAWGTSKTAVGTDAGIPTAATISTTAANPVCSDANGGVTTTSCPNVVGVGTENGAANALAVTVQGLPASITANTCVMTVVATGHSSTGATTLNVTPFTGATAYGAIAVNKRTTGVYAAISATGDIVAAEQYEFCYDATAAVWVVQTPSSTLYTGGAVAAGNLILGNANNQTTSSTKLVASTTTGAFTIINNLAVTGASGVSTVQASPTVITVGSGTSIGLTTLCTAALCPAGTYTVRAYLDITTACGTSGTYTVLLTWTDDAGSKSAFTIPLIGTGTSAGILTTTATANWGAALMTIRSTGATTIQYSTTAVACGTAGPMVGNLYLSATREQ